MSRTAPKHEHRYSHLKVRLGREELDRFIAAADAAGLTLSAWVRLVLRESMPRSEQSD